MNKIAYKKLLKSYLEKGYKFVYFNEYDENEKHIILRHDVDFSIDYALDMALIEWELGIKASYFFLTHGIYNFQSVPFEKFKELGHYTGLHVDYTHPQISREIAFNEVYSIHRPSKEDLNTDIENSTYNKKFFKKYSSDSNCKEPKELEGGQLLIHPIWWMTSKGDKQKKLKEFIKLTKLNSEKYIKNNIKL